MQAPEAVDRRVMDDVRSEGFPMELDRHLLVEHEHEDDGAAPIRDGRTAFLRLMLMKRNGSVRDRHREMRHERP